MATAEAESVVRYGPDGEPSIIIEDPPQYSMLPHCIVRDPHLSLGAKATAWAIGSYTEAFFSVDPASLETIAAHLGVTLDELRVYVGELQAAGFASRARRPVLLDPDEDYESEGE